jgi:hypothetical protein
MRSWLLAQFCGDYFNIAKMIPDNRTSPAR